MADEASEIEELKELLAAHGWSGVVSIPAAVRSLTRGKIPGWTRDEVEKKVADTLEIYAEFKVMGMADAQEAAIKELSMALGYEEEYKMRVIDP